MKTKKEDLLKKVKTGKLTPDESKEFEKLKTEYGVSPTGLITSLGALAKVMKVSRQTLHTWKKEPGFPSRYVREGPFFPLRRNTEVLRTLLRPHSLYVLYL